MPQAFEEILKGAMDLPRRQRLALAGFLLESFDEEEDSDVQAAWDDEIRARIRAIDEGRAVGVPLDEVMRQAEEILSR
jgi:putative addiction module component (TIGR02574 family)